jgi:hypothetical protein
MSEMKGWMDENFIKKIHQKRFPDYARLVGPGQDHYSILALKPEKVTEAQRFFVADILAKMPPSRTCLW